MNSIAPIVRVYLQTILWSNIGDDDIPLDETHTIEDFDVSVINSAKKDINVFMNNIGTLAVKYDPLTLVVDFLLTRNRTGAGFGDGDYGDDEDILIKAAKRFSELDVYIGDDNKIYQM